jgi:protocatechuate 3,4-dioxygenase beta subunit
MNPESAPPIVPAAPLRSAYTRRRALGLLGAGAGAALLGPAFISTSAADAATACTTETDEQEVGPFYVNEGLVRSDIRGGQSGVRLTLTMTILNSDACSPLVGAAVDVWQANALGVYSDESSEGTVGQTYLRGIQITNSSGQVTFTTIVPGWYSGRTQHIHVRVRTGGKLSGSSYAGGTLRWTGQLFFSAAVDAAVAEVSLYKSNSTSRTLNSTDRVYTQENGDENVVSITGSTSAGYAGKVSLSVGAGVTSVCTISGAATRTATNGRTVTVAGTAAPGAGVGVYFHRANSSGYVKRRTLTASSSGTWSTTYVANDDYRIYATSGTAKSAIVTVLVAPTIAGATTRSAAQGSTYTITGTGIPGATLSVHFHKAGTASNDYSIVRRVKVGSGGSWSYSFVASVDYRFYATLPNSQRSSTVLVQVT